LPSFTISDPKLEIMTKPTADVATSQKSVPAENNKNFIRIERFTNANVLRKRLKKCFRLILEGRFILFITWPVKRGVDVLSWNRSF
jgi:hypothetical protein